MIKNISNFIQFNMWCELVYSNRSPCTCNEHGDHCSAYYDSWSVLHISASLLLLILTTSVS